MNALEYLRPGELVSWIDRAVTRRINHDYEKPYNPPPVEAPAMSDEQFQFDNEMEKEVSRLSNPVLVAHAIIDLRQRVKELEDDNRSQG